ncbi:MAG: immunoglobulin-like domain-containing protein [Deferribacterales bacterium]
MRSKLKSLFIFSALVILLTGCGVLDGDGNHSGTESSAGADLDFYGVAAIGAPAAGYTVYLQSADGQLLQAVADGSGGYSINARNIQAPYLLWFELTGGEKIYAVTFQDGVVNLNAITSALTKAAYALSGGEDEDIDPASFSEDRFGIAQDALADFMQPVLALYGVDHEGFNSVQMPDFIADGFGVDGILDDFEISYDDASEEIKIRIKGTGTDIGSLDIDGVRNNEENVDNIDETSLASVTASMVAKTASNITFTAIAGENTSANNVVTALNLFTTYKNGTTVTWTSSDEAVSTDGTITRQSTDTTVTLTATVGKDDYTSTKSIIILVKAAESTGGGEEPPAEFDDRYDFLGNNRTAESVILNLNMPTSLSDGTTISWASSEPEYITTNGELLKRPAVSEGDKIVTLTATETKNSITETNIYTVTIPAIIPHRMSYGSLIKEDGSLWQSGEIANYSVGIGYGVHNTFTQEITGAYDWVSVSSNTSYTLAIKSDGTLWGWGFNHDKQLTSDDVLLVETPIQIGTDDDWVSVSLGMYLNVAVALKADGTAWVCGSNDYDIVPSADGESVQIPIQELSLASDWADVQVGYLYITGLKTDGTIWSWGRNYFGGFGTARSYDLTATPVQESTKATDWSAIDAYSGTAAVKKDGTLWLWGGVSISLFASAEERVIKKAGPSFYSIEAPMQEPSLSTDWVRPFFGSSIGGVKSDGTIWSFGSGKSCILGNGLCEDSLEIVQESTASTDWIDAVTAGANIYALKSDGSFWGWGSNNGGELGTGQGYLTTYEPEVYDRKSFVKVDRRGGGEYFCGIEADGDLWCKSYYTPFFYQVEGSWSDVVTDGYGVWGIKTDGTLWFWGSDYYGYFMNGGAYMEYDTPTQIGTATWKQIALEKHDSASRYMMGIQTDGTLWAMGRDSYYDGSAWVTTTSPTKLSDDSWSKIVLGNYRMAIKTDGTLWAWSSGDSTGLGDTIPPSYPVQIGTDTWKDVSISRGQYGIGVKTDGKLYGWGYSWQSFMFDDSYDYDVPTAMSNADTDWERVWVGYGYFAAQKSDGSLYTAGNNDVYPVYMQGLGITETSINTLRKVAGTYNDIFFLYDAVYAKGTDGKDYTWGRQGYLEFAEPNPIKIMD